MKQAVKGLMFMRIWVSLDISCDLCTNLITFPHSFPLNYSPDTIKSEIMALFIKTPRLEISGNFQIGPQDILK